MYQLVLCISFFMSQIGNYFLRVNLNVFYQCSIKEVVWNSGLRAYNDVRMDVML